MKKTQFLLSTGLFLLMGLSLVQAQTGWEWGDEPQKAKEKWTIFSDSEKMGDLSSAMAPMLWLFENTPNLNKSLYMKAVDVYHGLVKEETDDAKKAIYQDSALAMYDRRIQYFGEEDKVLNFKGGYAMTYWGVRSEKFPELYEMYTKILELNGEETFYYNAKYLMYVASVLKKAERVTEEEIIKIHEDITQVIEKNVAKNDDYKAQWQEAQVYVDAQLAEVVTIDCAFIQKYFIPELEAEPDNIDLIEEVLGRMLKAKCYTDSSGMGGKFLELSEKLVSVKPTFGRYNFLAKAYVGKKDYTKAKENYLKALEYTESTSEKGEVYMTLAKLYRSQGDKVSARSYSQKAAGVDASLAYEAFTLIGDLYLSSGGQCTDSNPVKAKAVYIAAYNAYQRAGNSAAMAKARQYFPSKTDIFNFSMGGQQVNVGCWIGETVTIPNL